MGIMAPKRRILEKVERGRALPAEFEKWAGKEKWTERNNAHTLAEAIKTNNASLFADLGGYRNAGMFLHNTHPLDAARFIKELGRGDAHKGVAVASALVSERMGANTRGGVAVDAAEFVTRYRPRGAAMLISDYGIEKVRANMGKLMALKKRHVVPDDAFWKQVRALLK